MPAMESKVEKRMKRWEEQRWLLDAVIRTIGPEWDMRRLNVINRACGPDAAGDVAAIRNRIHKFDDMSREFARGARRREAVARKYEEAGSTVAARESYFIASVLYGSAQWSIFDRTPENYRLNDKKTECYTKYAGYADREIRHAEIPFGDKSIPGWLHLPKDRPAGGLPCVLVIPGMDSFKEVRVAQYGDKLLERGVAVLAIDGPGQSEAILRGIFVTPTNWEDAGRAVLAWLRSQPEIDPERIAMTGTSAGSMWGTQAASVDDRIKGCGVQAVAHEPGRYTLFHMESPTYKLRYMYMSGIEDEDEFDRMSATISLRSAAQNISCPFLVIAGEDDSHSPVEYTYELLDLISSPKQMVLYEGAEHSVVGSSSVELGPNPANYMADWLLARLNGEPMETQHLFVDMAGQVKISSFEEVAREGMALA